MSTFYKKIEVLANVAIIAVALMIGGVLAYRYLSPKFSSKPSSASQIQPGTKIPLPNMNWSASDRTLLLVLQKGCHFCSESASFYQALVSKTAGRKNIRLVALLPQKVDEGRQYLKDLGVEVPDVQQTFPGAIGVSGTPTLILVDGSGSVTKSWVGRLSPQGEAEVFAQLGI